jgi:hypothetical protein
MATPIHASDDTLSRLGAWSLVAGGALGVVLAVVFHLTGANRLTADPAALTARGIGAVDGLLLVLGLPVLAGRLGRRSPLLASAGLVTTMIAILVYYVFLGVFDWTIQPYLAQKHVELTATSFPFLLLIVFLIAGVAQLFGGILLGITAFRTHAVSRLAAGLLIGSSVLFLGTLGPPDAAYLRDWFDSAAYLALMAGLGLAGLELLGIPSQRTEVTATARGRTQT